MLYIIMIIGNLAFFTALIRFIMDIRKPSNKEGKAHYYQRKPNLNL